jgi:Recombinase
VDNDIITLGDAIIYLRMSDFRDEDFTTFGEREQQLRDFAAGLGIPAGRIRVVIENDAGNGGFRPASAYKRPARVTTATGLVPSEDSADGIGSLRITRGGTREEIRSFRERARAAHDYSADISDKVQRGRKRWAGKSYWGGRRPYGRMIDPAAPRHAKRLITVPEEAKVLQDAVTDVLDRGISLRAVAADLRGRGLRTVTGKPFSAVSLRDALLASHVAGIATCNGAQYDASSWLEPIIEPDRWERLTEMLTDPARRTNPHNANAPRWLLSGHARCGICDDGTMMHASGMGGYGPERGSAYRCDKGSHCATPAIPADQVMAQVMIARLSQPDIAGLLPAPEPRQEVDVRALRAESRKLHAKRDDLARLLSEDVLTEAGVRQERKRIDARLAQISTELADATQIDLLPERRLADAVQQRGGHVVDQGAYLAHGRVEDSLRPAGSLHALDQPGQETARGIVSGRLIALIGGTGHRAQVAHLAARLPLAVAGMVTREAVAHQRLLDQRCARVGMLAVIAAVARAGDLLDIDPQHFGEPRQDSMAVDAAPASLYLGKPRLRPADKPREHGLRQAPASPRPRDPLARGLKIHGAPRLRS